MKTIAVRNSPMHCVKRLLIIILLTSCIPGKKQVNIDQASISSTLNTKPASHETLVAKSDTVLKRINKDSSQPGEADLCKITVGSELEILGLKGTKEATRSFATLVAINGVPLNAESTSCQFSTGFLWGPDFVQDTEVFVALADTLLKQQDVDSRRLRDKEKCAIPKEAKIFAKETASGSGQHKAMRKIKKITYENRPICQEWTDGFVWGPDVSGGRLEGEFYFPYVPPAGSSLANYYSEEGQFGGNRDGGARKHAGVDIYAGTKTSVGLNANRPIYAITNGKIIEASYFQWGVYQVIVDHRPAGNFVARYLETNGKLAPGLSEGSDVEAGQMISYLGTVSFETGTRMSMLHLEMYRGDRSGSSVSTKLNNCSDYSYVRPMCFHRRGDLLNPEPFLQQWIQYMPH